MNFIVLVFNCYFSFGDILPDSLINDNDLEVIFHLTHSYHFRYRHCIIINNIQLPVSLYPTINPLLKY
jgi:hypothetical protein